MEGINKILEKVSKQRAELVYKGLEPQYVFLDEGTYRKLKIVDVKYNHKKDSLEFKTYLDLDLLMGLKVMIVSNGSDDFISVGI